ncbi:hypothetical protein HHI36_013495 [Cryptolaemus montrouzieri]|uniref:Uncharacterized protein n=1 Tax=Cryptolaemus montrouzieri TaxID=559131 RepID=A0ABD2NHG5_9CUCU
MNFVRKQYVHFNCIGLQTDNLKTSEIGSFRWICNTCKSKSTTSGSTRTKLDKIMSELASITKNQTEFVKSLNFYGDKIQELEKKFKNIESFDNRMNDISMEMSALKNENLKLENEFNIMQQNMKSTELDIIGVPEKKNENVAEIVKMVSSKINFPSVESTIHNCNRVHFSKDCQNFFPNLY